MVKDSQCNVNQKRAINCMRNVTPTLFLKSINTPTKNKDKEIYQHVKCCL